MNHLLSIFVAGALLIAPAIGENANTTGGKNAATQTAAFSCDIAGCTRTDKHTHALCAQSNCNDQSEHRHGDEWYYGHSGNDGHAHSNQYCGLAGCTKDTEHSHSVCSVSGCSQAGTHTHNGVTYYGHHNGDGHGHGTLKSTGSGSGHNSKSHGGKHH